MALAATGDIDPAVLAEQEEWEDVQGVFALIDHQHKGSITEAALAQALLSTSLLDEAGSRARAGQGTLRPTGCAMSRLRAWGRRRESQERGTHKSDSGDKSARRHSAHDSRTSSRGRVADVDADAARGVRFDRVSRPGSML